MIGIKIKIPVTKFKESKAFKKSTKINPKEVVEDIKIFFKNKFRLKIIAKNNGIKKDNNWIAFAWVIVSG